MAGIKFEVGDKWAGIDMQRLAFQLVAEMLPVIEIELAGERLWSVKEIFNLKRYYIYYWNTQTKCTFR